MYACHISRSASADAPMGRELIEQIQARMPELSPIMQSIGGYCLRTHDRLHEQSIDQVAGHCGTVPSSVVRFTRLFGHRGYHDFKLAFLGRKREACAEARSVDADEPGLVSSRLLGSLDEDLHQLAQVRTLLEAETFQTALNWIRSQSRMSLTFHGELDRMVAMHLGDVLQAAGKFVLLADSCQIGHPAEGAAEPVCIHVDLERGRGPAYPSSTDRSGLVVRRGQHVHLLGTQRLLKPTTFMQKLTLPVFGSTLGRRLQKALSIADTISTALH
jgi:Helix-turn-helix domain, rpiR family